MSNHAKTVASFALALACAVVGATMGLAAGACLACVAFGIMGVVIVASRDSMQARAKAKEANDTVCETLRAQEDVVTAPDHTSAKTGADSPTHNAEPQDDGDDAQTTGAEQRGSEHSAVDQNVQAPHEPTTDEPLSEDSPSAKRESQSSAEDSQPQRPTSESQSTDDPLPFDYDAFCRSLLLARNPLLRLRTLVSDVEEQKDKGEPVVAARTFLARLLTEAGINDDAELRDLDVVRPHRTGMFYLRCDRSRVPYATLLRVLQMEAALNALFFGHDYYGNLNDVSEHDLYRTWQRSTASICAQVPNVDMANWSYLAMPWQVPFGPSDHGEWSVRHAIAEAIESVMVPYRLEARFRCNVADGDVAIEFLATPWRVFARSALVEGMGIVPTTNQMRKREATAYAARIGLLLANHAFRAAPKIRRVWVSAIEETPTTHRCLYSACMGRRAFSSINMDAIRSPLSTLRTLGASFDEADGVFVPTQPIFYLEDERFCPQFRHDLWSLGERVLPTSASRSLGAQRVSDLHVYEELPRMLAADKMLRMLPRADSKHSTQQSVHAIMDVAGQMSDITVWHAAERTAKKLVDGRLSPDEFEDIRNEIVSGDGMSQAVQRAERRLMSRNPQEALHIVSTMLEPYENRGTYVDTDAVAYRSFNGFAERVVYNRLNLDDHRTVVLVPDAYLTAHLIASAVLMSLPAEEGGDAQKALQHAQRALQIAPLSDSANLSLAACLEATGDTKAASEQLKNYLQVAYQPQGMGLAYFRLGSLQQELGNSKTCMACYQQAVRCLPPLLPFVLSELQELGEEGEDGIAVELMGETQLTQTLAKEDIPLAPTPQTSYILYDGAIASVDAEVFPVARELMHVLEILSGDDVLHGIRTSLEREPDA